MPVLRHSSINANSQAEKGSTDPSADITRLCGLHYWVNFSHSLFPSNYTQKSKKHFLENETFLGVLILF